jgi:mono/diheme cytochrome c family protein
MKPVYRCFAFVVLLGVVTATRAFAQGDVEAGREFAERVCAECHGVKEGQVSADLRAPPFNAIAATPGMTGFALAAALHTTHTNMPNFILTEEERLNVITYILSLKP